MSTTTIILIIGAVFLLLAIADSIKIQGNSLDLINNKLRIPLGLLGFALIGFGIFQSVQTNDMQHVQPSNSASKDTMNTIQEPEEKLIQETSITYPIDGQSIRCTERVKGVYPANLENDIWVLLKPKDNRYYPQSDSNKPAKKKNGEWKVTCRFAGDKDEDYELIIFETNQTSSEFFSQTIDKWNSKRKYPGLKYDQIPKDAEEIERIVVTSEISCRGVH